MVLFKKRVGCVIAYTDKHNNYGTSLQGFATVKKIQDLGYDCEIIKYTKRLSLLNKIKLVYLMCRCGGTKDKMRIVKERLNMKCHPDYAKNIAIRTTAVNAYKAKRLIPLFHEYIGFDALRHGSLNYNAVLVGSDQLWLPGNIAADYYTLNFVPETVNSIAYATSFGQSSLPKDSTKKAEVFLKKIKHIGVREESGQKLVKEIANRDVPVVCDPTLLFTGDEWMAIQQKEPIVKGKYILCYFLGNNPPHREFAKRLKEATGCKIIALTHLDEFVKSDEGYADETPYDIDPADFLNLIRNAEYVCTDSFHCSVFSILYNRQFFTFRRYNRNTKQSTNSRLDTLFHMAGITGRLLMGEENIADCLKIETDFESVHKKLEGIRQKSYEYLLTALKDEGSTDL